MQIISKSPKETLHLGKRMSQLLKGGDIICLFGNLGSGKTVLTKGIAWGMGIKKEKVVSPSFVLIRQYTKVNPPLYHFDLYRLKDPKEIIDLGYEEYFYNGGVAVIEWADRLDYLLPKEYLKVELSLAKDLSRLIKFKAYGARYETLLEKINEDFRH
ncbi:MAG: tRNA (adenosine(37)-N6)-threonylcarbamoyltransferase complex ATPase subunit type 1 TsaE [Candidatus Omnitrophota bacterium]